MNVNQLLAMTLLILMIEGCAPKAETVEPKKPITPELLTNDVSLQKMYPRPFATTAFALKNINPAQDSSLESIKNLYEIGTQLSDQNASDKAFEDFKKMKSNSTLIQKKYQDSYYLQLVEEQTRSKVKNSVSAVEKQILADTEKIISIIPQIAQVHFSQISAKSGLSEQLSVSDQFLKALIQKIQTMTIYPELKEKVVASLNSESTAMIQKISSFNTQYNQMIGLGEKLNLIVAKISEFNIDLDTETLSSLNSGQHLGRSINQISDAPTALQTLALTWQLLTVEERIQYFQQANQKLFDLFNKKDPQDIECLIQGNCKGLISKLVLKMGVYPALEDYGIDKIKVQINESAVQFLNQKINGIAFAKIQQLPASIQNEIQTSVDQNIQGLQDFQKNFKQNMARGLARTLESEKIELSLQNKNQELKEWILFLTNQIYSLSFEKQYQKTQFNLIESVLSLVDYSNQKKSLLKNGISQYLKSIPEIFLLSELNPNTSNVNTNTTLKISDQAQALKFLSLMISATADWKKGPFDSGLTQLKAQDLIADYKSDQLNDQVFPQLELLNICFSMTAQILKQIQSENSLIYLINNQNLRIPIHSYLADPNRPSVALAAVSDQVNHRTLNTTNVQDIALMIEALFHFSKATHGFINSQSELLKQPEIKNQILAAQKNIDLLILSLANFISSQMIGADHVIAESYDFETQTVSVNTNLKDQTSAISALIMAYERTGIDLYLFSAKEIYYALNRKFYDPNLKFYKTSLKPSALITKPRDEVTMALNHLLPLRKYLSLTSQIQFDRIFENWYVATLM